MSSTTLLTEPKVIDQQQPAAGSCAKVNNVVNNNVVDANRLLGVRMLDKGVPKRDSTADTKLSWLRSQVIGGTAEIDTPFGKRKLTYADHTASGRCLCFIEDYIIQNVLPFYGNSHTRDSYVGDQTTKIIHEATEFVKKCLGGKQDDAILICGSGTTAAIKRLQEVMGIAIPSTLRERVLESCLRGEERWLVFVGPYEHHSNILSWRQSLAEVIEIRLDNQSMIDMDDLKFQLEFYQKSGRPMLGSFSACSNVTGICSNPQALARLLHQFGAFACFDFASSGPYVEIDMRSGETDGFDAIFLSPHKFIGGPGSPGILLMSKALYRLKSSPPSTCGGGTVNFVNCFDEKDTIYVNDIEEREDAGTPQIIQRVKAALAFWVKEYIGYTIITKKEHDYIQRALERLLPNQNIWVLGNTSVKRQPILSFLVYTTTYSSLPSVETEGKATRGLYLWGETGNKRDKPLDGAFVAKLLNDLFGIQARGGCACAGPYAHRLLGIDQPQSLAIKSAVKMGYNGFKPGWTRVSFPYYMANEEFEFILAAIEFIAAYGQRFLPFYNFNWNTGCWTFKMKAFEETLQNAKDCKSCSLLSADTLKALRVNNSKTGGKEGNGALIVKYTSYLEAAKHIANILPKFTSQCTVPKDIDLDSLFFRL